MRYIKRIGKGYVQEPAFDISSKLYELVQGRAPIPKEYYETLALCAKNARGFLKESRACCSRHISYALCVDENGDLLFTVDGRWERLSTEQSYKLLRRLEETTKEN